MYDIGRRQFVFGKTRPSKTGYSNIEVVFVDSVARIGKDVWDALCAPRQYCRYDYMTALEASHLDCSFVYAIAQNTVGIAGIIVATLWRIPLLGKMTIRVLTTGTPVNTGLPLMLSPEADVVEISGALLRAMEEKANELGVRLFVGRDLPTPDFATLPHLERLYFCAWLELTWPDFEQYLASRSKRKSLRREMRAIENAGYTLEVRQGHCLTQEEAQRLHQLWLQLYNKHRSADQILVTKEFFLEMSTLEHAVWLLLRKDGVIHAFDLCFALGDILESTYCGLDFSLTGNLAVHRVMGYEIVRYAIEKRFNAINFGISNEQSKIDAGCRFRTHYAWIEAYPKWLGMMLRPALLKAILQDSGIVVTDLVSTP